MSDDPGRRTSLAVERTYLAWWRTGLTAFAVALATARVVPDLSKAKVEWPYTVLGIGFAVFGCACFALGHQRLRRGESEDVDEGLMLAMIIGVLLLGAGLIVVLVINP
ncbi:MAG: putative rane protein [Thermoleophilaceae bacterium]|jgi:putative membrane protein|nr:putative rane protein [Thermoleophilaceae bacterium]